MFKAQQPQPKKLTCSPTKESAQFITASQPNPSLVLRDGGR
jgi:hypothetical protein